MWKMSWITNTLVVTGEWRGCQRSVQKILNTHIPVLTILSVQRNQNQPTERSTLTRVYKDLHHHQILFNHQWSYPSKLLSQRVFQSRSKEMNSGRVERDGGVTNISLTRTHFCRLRKLKKVHTPTRWITLGGTNIFNNHKTLFVFKYLT